MFLKSVHQNDPEGLLKQFALLSPKVSDQICLGWGWDLYFQQVPSAIPGTETMLQASLI